MARKGRILLVSLALLIVAFVVFRKPFLRATMPEVGDVKLSEFVLLDDSAFVNLSLVVRNKGVWRIELKRVELGIYDDTLQIMSYESDTLRIIERNQVRKEELYCKIPFKDVIKKIREHQGEDTVGLNMKGVLVFSTFLGESTTEIDRKIPVNVPIPPRIYVREIEFQGKEKGDYNLLFDIALHNDNPREIELENVLYELKAGQNIDLHGHLNDVTIAARDSTRFKVPAVMEVANRLVLISQIVLDKDQMPYSFVMKGTIVSLTGIVEDDVPMTVNTSGQLELYNEDKRERTKITLRRKDR